MTAYYNELDSYAAEWLRNLIREGHIAPGDVDERSIVDVAPNDLRGYTQCHFFAGIGGWSYALRLVGWPDDRSVWTGSCPCQPFSSAGQQLGTADERHLWPQFLRLVAERRPPVVFGEQVASRAGRGWLAGVRADLEVLGYGVGAADLCAAGVGAPHIRQRLWWVADAGCDGRSGRGGAGDVAGAARNAEGEARERKWLRTSAGDGCADGGLPDASDEGLQVPEHAALCQSGRRGEGRATAEFCCACSGWTGVWIPCADGKARRIEPGLEPLAHGVPNRVGRLRAYGNAIVPEVAEAFIRACAGA